MGWSNKTVTWAGKHELRLCAFVLAAVTFLPVWVASQCGHSLMDDAYITLTYAKSLAGGRGFVFNHPPPTYGTTSALLTLLTAFGVRVTGGADPATVAVALTTACWIGVAWIVFLFRDAYNARPWQALVIGLLVLGSGQVWLGHEYYLFQFLLFLSAGLFFGQHWYLCGLTTGLLFLTRGEGILLLPLCLVWRGWTWLRIPHARGRTLASGLWLMGGFLTVLAPWAIYAVTEFGRILPDTLAAKMAQGRLDVPYDTFGAAMVDWASRWWYWDRPVLRMLPVFFWGLALLGLIYLLRRRHRWLGFAAWCLAYVTGYTLLRVQGYWWYQLPVYFVWLTLIGWGLIAILEWSAATQVRWRAWATAGAIGLTVAAVTLHIALTLYRTQHYIGDERAPTYRALANWLNTHTQPDALVAFTEVGYLGYFTDNRILDLWGLVTPEVLPELLEHGQAWVVLQHLPDYYIDTDPSGIPELVSSPDFGRHYRQCAIIHGPPPRERLTIYERPHP